MNAKRPIVLEKGITPIPPTGLTEYNHRDTVTISGKVIPGFTARYFKKFIGPHEVTMGVYRDGKGKFAFRSWGVYGVPNCCRFHQVKTVHGKWSASIPGGPQLSVIEKKGKVIGLSIKTMRGVRTFEC